MFIWFFNYNPMNISPPYHQVYEKGKVVHVCVAVNNEVLIIKAKVPLSAHNRPRTNRQIKKQVLVPSE